MKTCETCGDGKVVARFECVDGPVDVCRDCELALLAPESFEEVGAVRVR